ncbi:MAG: antibiotic biosynthesis monooxygenase family protein [Bacteroidota bacterium]
MNLSTKKTAPLYGLHSSLVAKPTKGRELANILLEASQLLQKVKGCHLYAISLDKSKPDTVWIMEIWDSKEDHDNSLKLVEVRELIAQAIPILEKMPEQGLELEVVGGLGVQ